MRVKELHQPILNIIAKEEEAVNLDGAITHLSSVFIIIIIKIRSITLPRFRVGNLERKIRPRVIKKTILTL